MSAVDALGISVSSNPEMSGVSYKKLRDIEGSGSGDFNAVITAKISTSIQDLRSAGQNRSADVSLSGKGSNTSVSDISSPSASKSENVSYGRASSKIKETSFEKKGETSPYDDKVKDALEKFENDVKAEIKKVLDVSDEDIENAMEELSLSYVDLTDVSKLSMLFMKLSGISDQSELLLTDGFLELKNSIGELSNELFSVTGLGVEELNIAQGMISSEGEDGIVLDDTKAAEVPEAPALSEQENSAVLEGVPAKEEAVPTGGLPDENETVPDIPKDAVKTPLNEGTKVESGDEALAGEKNENDVAAPVKEASSDGAKEVIASSEKKPAEDTKGLSEKASNEDVKAKPDGLLNEPAKSVSPEQNQNPLTGQNERGNEQAANTNIFGSNNAEVVTETPETPVTPYTQQSFNPSDVARQMVTGVRTVVTESLKTMELQLNPENLGKMIIHVSEQDGQLTARINIQNENVRTAMEEQMAIVKNNLEAQGLKIESVTVTADAHEFERNLEEGNAPSNDMNSQEGRQADGEASEGGGNARQGIRSLNMNELEGGGITDLNEDELLAARIMRENGSTLNINA